MSAGGHPLNVQQLKVWRREIALEVRHAEYEVAKAKAMLARVDAEIRKLEEAG